MTLAFLPSGTTVGDLAAAGFSPGVMSAGLGAVSADQTYLDIGQGNRVFDSLYDEDLPSLRAAGCLKWQEAAVRRAESAPAEIQPGLLFVSLNERGVGILIETDSPGCQLGAFEPNGADDGLGYMVVGDSTMRKAARVAGELHKGDLVIAIARPTGRSDEPLPIGIAGRGFDGNLTSDTTRTNGYVTSTDVAPTILERFGIPVPDAMSGQAIRAEGEVDVGAIEDLAARMAVISHRRGPVVALPVAIWIVLALLVVLASRGALGRPAIRLLGMSVLYLPLVLLAGAAIEPSQSAEALLVALGCPALGAATLALSTGYRPASVAAAAGVLAYAIDVVAGSPLTKLSLLGSNPGLGVRFYGIGNELEALLTVLVVAGTGAALAGFAPRLGRERAAATFLAVGLLSAFVFAAGAFGADVGAAIVMPVGAAVAAVAIAGRGRRRVLAIVAAPFVALGALALLDLVTSADSHFTRSVLDAGGLHSLGDVAQRRLALSAHSFARPVLLAFLPVIAVLATLAWRRRDRLGAWLDGAPALRAGLLGALVATVVGTLANDSGALLLEIGTAYLLVFVGFAWTESDPAPPTKSHTQARPAWKPAA